MLLGTTRLRTRLATPLDVTERQFERVADAPEERDTRTEYVPAGNVLEASFAVICVNESTEMEVAG